MKYKYTVVSCYGHLLLEYKDGILKKLSHTLKPKGRNKTEEEKAETLLHVLENVPYLETELLKRENYEVCDSGKSQTAKDPLFDSVKLGYKELVLNQTGAHTNANSVKDSVAFNQIIQFMRNNAQQRLGNSATSEQIEEAALNSWFYLVRQWSRVHGLSAYYGNQVKAIQIANNLPNIISLLKNDRSTNDTEEARSKRASIYSRL